MLWTLIWYQCPATFSSSSKKLSPSVIDATVSISPPFWDLQFTASVWRILQSCCWSPLLSETTSDIIPLSRNGFLNRCFAINISLIASITIQTVIPTCDLIKAWECSKGCLIYWDLFFNFSATQGQCPPSCCRFIWTDFDHSCWNSWICTIWICKFSSRGTSDWSFERLYLISCLVWIHQIVAHPEKSTLFDFDIFWPFLVFSVLFWKLNIWDRLLWSLNFSVSVLW